MIRRPFLDTAPRIAALNVTLHKLDDIRLESDYLRTDTDVEALKKSLENVGLINPVTVSEGGQLLAGARRYQAAKELGWEEIAAQTVDRGALEQELISIDENLVRAPLSSMQLERCLNRGREIYEALKPEARKVDLSTEEPKGEEKQAKKAEEEQDEDSFAAVTAEKTGLSKAVIKGAIKRDELASEAVKAARSQGELNATQTNEIIRLDKEVQEEILPLVADKTVKEVRRIVSAAIEGGVEAAAEESEKVVPLPREYGQLRSPVKRLNKTITRILVEGLEYEGPERDRIHGELRQLHENLGRFFEMAATASPGTEPGIGPE